MDGVQGSAAPASGASGVFDTVACLLTQAMATLAEDPVRAQGCIVNAGRLLDGLGPAPSISGSGALAPWQVLRVRRHIEANLGKRLYGTDLAAVAKLSFSHFARAFKVSFGMTPSAFVMTRRIALAQHLMISTPSQLCEIALDCGLANQAHLCRVFRRHVGQSPAAWRRAAVVETESVARRRGRKAA
ncbi:MAG: helix-turn-helix transcriptional regulator [Caulobacter sp.]|nr:helix-turn-helix transcriptional regulator [Caulobacter sp.]